MNTVRRLLSPLLLAGYLLASISPAQAQIYKWVDKDGNTVYSQTPPESGNYQSIDAPSAPPASAATNDTAGSSTDNTIQQGAEEAKKNAEVEKLSQENQAVREQNCKAAKQNLQTFQIYRRIKQADGTVVRLSDEERQKKIDEMKQAIKDFCD